MNDVSLFKLSEANQFFVFKEAAVLKDQLSTSSIIAQYSLVEIILPSEIFKLTFFLKEMISM